MLRTPDERFADAARVSSILPKYVEIEGLRMAYVEEGSGDPILMLHGEPTWGYLYRRMIPLLRSVGRVIVPDLIGFGRSDKPVARNAYSYKSHVRWMREFVAALDLHRVTLVVPGLGRIDRLAGAGARSGTIRAIGGDEHRTARRQRAQPKVF